MSTNNEHDQTVGGIDRRNFIKAAGASAGVMIMASRKSLADEPAPAAAAPAEGAKNDKINIAMIGCGGRSNALFGQLLKMKGRCEVVAVCDVYARRRAAAREKCEKAGMSPTEYLYYGDVLDRKDVDAVFIATPDHWHATIALEAMQKGKDVYCEKPMTHTIPEAKAMAEAEHKLGRIVQVGSQTTSADQWWKAKKAIADGMIGKLLQSQGSYHRNSTGGEWNYGIDPGVGPDKQGLDHIDWELWQKPAENHRPFDAPRFFRFRKYWDYSGGVATDLFFHVMAPLNICWPNPEFPWRVVGTGGIYAFDDGREVPDTFMLAADYPTGHSVVLSSSMANDTHIPGLIRGHEGTITMVDHGKFEAPTPSITVRPQDIGNGDDNIKKKFVDKYGTDDLKIKTEMGMDPLPKHIGNFFDCIRSREETVLSARKAYRVQVAICLGMTSYKESKVMYFDTEKEEETDRRPANTLKLDKPGCINGDKVQEPNVPA